MDNLRLVWLVDTSSIAAGETVFDPAAIYQPNAGALTMTQLDIFNLPRPTDTRDGIDQIEVSKIVSSAMKQATFTDREKIANALSQRSGRKITKNTLDAYASAARPDHPIPFWLVPVFEATCETTELTDWLVEKRGGRVHYGKDALDAEIGRLEVLKDEALRDFNQKLKDLKKLKGVL